MTWRHARLATLVVAAPLLVGLAAGATFEIARRASPAVAPERLADARSSRPAAQRAPAIDALWNRLARKASLHPLAP
jgi:hypothetical protein